MAKSPKSARRSSVTADTSRPICGRPPPRKVFYSFFDQIACVHMSGLFVRSHMNAGQDGFRDESSIQKDDLVVRLRHKFQKPSNGAAFEGVEYRLFLPEITAYAGSPFSL